MGYSPHKRTEPPIQGAQGLQHHFWTPSAHCGEQLCDLSIPEAILQLGHTVSPNPSSPILGLTSSTSFSSVSSSLSCCSFCRLLNASFSGLRESRGVLVSPSTGVPGDAPAFGPFGENSPWDCVVGDKIKGKAAAAGEPRHLGSVLLLWL